MKKSKKPTIVYTALEIKENAKELGVSEADFIAKELRLNANHYVSDDIDNNGRCIMDGWDLIK